MSTTIDDASVEMHEIRDRVRWGPVWAGLVTAIATFVLLQLVFFATDAVSLDVNPSADGETALPFWSGLAAIVGFLLGGLVTGASSRWRRVSDGLLQGVVLWAVTTLALVVASGLAAGQLTSSLGGTLGRLADLRTELADTGSLTEGELADARDAAAAAVLLLGLMFAATVVGAVAGIKLWPRWRPLAAPPVPAPPRDRWWDGEVEGEVRSDHDSGLRTLVTDSAHQTTGPLPSHQQPSHQESSHRHAEPGLHRVDHDVR